MKITRPFLSEKNRTGKWLFLIPEATGLWAAEDVLEATAEETAAIITEAAVFLQEAETEDPVLQICRRQQRRASLLK